MTTANIYPTFTIKDLAKALGSVRNTGGSVSHIAHVAARAAGQSRTRATPNAGQAAARQVRRGHESRGGLPLLRLDDQGGRLEALLPGDVRRRRGRGHHLSCVAKSGALGEALEKGYIALDNIDLMGTESDIADAKKVPEFEGLPRLLDGLGLVPELQADVGRGGVDRRLLHDPAHVYHQGSGRRRNRS